MIPRYADDFIDELFSDKAKLMRWQETELAVIEARVNLGLLDPETYEGIRSRLLRKPINLNRWRKLDGELKHDLNAFIAERRRFLPKRLQADFHEDMTSYDVEEPALARALTAAGVRVQVNLEGVIALLSRRANEHRYTIMLERTHGQHAKLRSLGSRFLTYIAQLRIGERQLLQALELCGQSRISGAVGNYGGGLTPEIEREALRILGLTPFYGATQIAPRELYAPLAQSLTLICDTLNKIAVDIRLGCRSGLPIFHESFGKSQMGSSAMPHKKNPINTEQMRGMAWLGNSFSQALVECIETWEGRSIEQSCVERIAWPDLFHVSLRMISVMTKVIGGLVIYQDHMLREIIESRGTYASDEAKNFLARVCARRGVASETAYRIIQLAAFCVFKPKGFWADARACRNGSLADADQLLAGGERNHPPDPISIRDFIAQARLFPVDDLECDEVSVDAQNVLLRDIFSVPEIRTEWMELFKPSHLLRNEAYLFKEILGS